MTNNRNVHIANEEILDAVLQVVERTRFYIGQKRSAPYARAAKEVLQVRGIMPPDELYEMIERRN